MKKITIITITYNAETVLEKTIQSILNQTDKNFEYIIVDGASTDNTVEIIRKYEKLIADNFYDGFHKEQFQWISEPDNGLYEAMNKGIDLAKGEFLWFMNAGDKIFNSNTLLKLQHAIVENPNADIFYGQSLVIDSNDNLLGKRHKIAPEILTKKSLLNGLVVCHQSIIVRKTIAPYYDLQYKISADYDWTIKSLSRSKKNLYLNESLSRFMVAGISSLQRKTSWKERFYIMKKHYGLTQTLWAHLKIVLKYPFTRKY